jgi:hypothetical protein
MNPHLPTLRITLAIVFVLSVLMMPSGQDANHLSNKKPYARTGSEAAVSGTIAFTGQQPKTLKIDMSSDPVCHEANPDPKIEATLVKNDRLANVFVYVKSVALDAYSFDSPASPALLEHKGCRYVPHVLAMQAGQPLMILNSDPTQHNTHPAPKHNLEWNISQGIGSAAISKTFDKPEVIPFKDNMHPWERAYVGVFSHPFFAISDEDGNYKIAGLPAGQYTLIAWHERLGEKTVDLVLVPGESRHQAFTFDAER